MVTDKERGVLKEAVGAAEARVKASAVAEASRWDRATVRYWLDAGSGLYTDVRAHGHNQQPPEQEVRQEWLPQPLLSWALWIEKTPLVQYLITSFLIVFLWLVLPNL